MTRWYMLLHKFSSDENIAGRTEKGAGNPSDQALLTRLRIQHLGNGKEENFTMLIHRGTKFTTLH